MLRSTHFTTASITAILSAATVGVAAPTPIAVTGTVAPGGTGGTYNLFSNPILNANGQVAFQASLLNGTSTGGVFTGTAGAIDAVALQNTVAPGTGGALFGTLYSAATTVTVNLNANGQLAFLAPLTAGTPATLTSGVFFGTSSASLQPVALRTYAAPAGGNYEVFSATGINAASSPVLNGAGQVAFSSTLTGGVPSPGAGIFVGAPGALQTAALLGGAAPAGGTYTTALTPPVLNGAGQVMFVSLLGSPTPQALFVGAAGSVQEIARQGAAAPGAGTAAYGTFSQTSINDAGRVSFLSSSLTGGTSTSGLFSGTPGNIQPVILNNTAAPNGGTFSSFTNATINKLGQVAFSSTLTGGTSAGNNLFQTDTSGVVRAAALIGDANPDGSGATFASFSSGLVQNGAGQFVFITNLAGTGVTTGTNSVALIAGVPGNLVQLVRTGDVIDVDADPLVDNFKTVSALGLLINAGGQDGKGINFNDSGLLAYRLGFTDGTGGIFTSVVPEPTALSALALAGFGLLRRRTSAARSA